MRLEKKPSWFLFLGHYEKIETQAAMKIVFLEDFLGDATFSQSGETQKDPDKSTGGRNDMGKAAYCGLKQSSASFWQLCSQAFFQRSLAT